MSSPSAATKEGKYLSRPGSGTIRFWGTRPPLETPWNFLHGPDCPFPRPQSLPPSDHLLEDLVRRKDRPDMTAGAFAVKWQSNYAGAETKALEARFLTWCGK